MFYGEGPEQPSLARAIRDHGLSDIATTPGFAPSDVVQADVRRALCMLLPSRREGYGMVVVEAAALSTPSIVVAGEDNAAVELIVDGVNGLIVSRSDASVIADAIVQVHEAGLAMRERTAQWFATNCGKLSLDQSLATVLGSYSAT